MLSRTRAATSILLFWGGSKFEVTITSLWCNATLGTDWLYLITYLILIRVLLILTAIAFAPTWFIFIGWLRLNSYWLLFILFIDKSPLWFILLWILILLNSVNSRCWLRRLLLYRKSIWIAKSSYISLIYLLILNGLSCRVRSIFVWFNILRV